MRIFAVLSRIQNRFRATSIRTKLLGLVLFALLPALGAVLHSGIQAEHRALDEAEVRIDHLVLDLASRQEQLTASTRQLLVTLSRVPAVRQLRAGECSALFRQLLAANPVYSNIMLADASGRVLASGQDAGEGLSMSGLEHFEQTLRTQAFTVGRYMASRVTGLAVLPFCFPVSTPDGHVAGVLVAGVRMDHYDTVAERLDLPLGSTVFMADTDGVRLFNRHLPNPRPDLYPPGQPVTLKLRELLSQSPRGKAFAGVDINGKPRLYVLRSPALAPGEPAYIHIGVSVLEQQVRGPARAARNRTLLLLGVTAAVAALAAWTFGDRVFARRITRLAEVSASFAGGDLSARTGLPESGDELGRLARSVDQIGEQLSLREAERAETLARLSRTQFAVDHAGEEIYWADREGRLVYVNERACRSLGYSAEELRAMSVFDVDCQVPREDWNTFLELLSTSGPSVIETVHRSRDGRTTPKEISATLMEVDGRVMICGAAHDISGRKRYERLLRSLVEGTVAVTGAAFFTALAERMVQVLDVHAAFVCEYLPGREDTARVHALHAGGESLPARDCPVGPAPCYDSGRHAASAPGMADENGTCHCAGGTARRFPQLPELAGAGIRSCQGVDLTDASGRIIGSLAVLDTKPLPPDVTLGDTLTLFGLRASAELERLAIEREVLASLKEKETMLREIHHRVKNNLQIISSLLNLQAYAATDPAALCQLAESRARILSMALVHEDLYQSDSFTRVDFRRYLSRLTERVAGAMRGSAEVAFELDMEDLALPIDKAIPLGLLTNELLTNAVKHAFPGRASGLVTVGLRTEQGAEGATGVLTVRDDGVGLPPDFRPGTGGSLGMQLIWSLAAQLNGGVVAENAQEGPHGAAFTLRFPLPAQG